MRRLKTECEEAKKLLSIYPQTKIEVDSLTTEHDFAITITRPKFESLIADLLAGIVEKVEKTIEKSSLTKNEISQVVLTGGCCRIPKIVSTIQ